MNNLENKVYKASFFVEVDKTKISDDIIYGTEKFKEKI